METMATEMSVTQALAEVKLLEKRLQKTLDTETTQWIAVATKTRPVDVAELKRRAQAADQSFMALVGRRDRLKQAIVKSNATTQVKIGEWTGTVAEAIERKTSIRYKQEFLGLLKNQYSSALETYKAEQEEVNRRLDRMLTSELGKDVRTNPDTIAALTTTFRENNKVELVDPIHLADQIARFEEEIDTFVTNVDWVLSESNGRTMVSI
jgi:hypothetical protein